MNGQVPLIALIPNYLLAALMYTLLGRLLLSFLYAPDSKNVVYRVFERVSEPVLRLVRPITPAIVPPAVLMVFAAIWLLLARIIVTLAILDAVKGA